MFNDKLQAQNQHLLQINYGLLLMIEHLIQCPHSVFDCPDPIHKAASRTVIRFKEQNLCSPPPSGNIESEGNPSAPTA